MITLYTYEFSIYQYHTIVPLILFHFIPLANYVLLNISTNHVDNPLNDSEHSSFLGSMLKEMTQKYPSSPLETFHSYYSNKDY